MAVGAGFRVVMLQIAEVRPVSPKRFGDGAGEARLVIGIGHDLIFGDERRERFGDLARLHPAIGVLTHPGTRLEILHGLEQLTVEVGLGQQPGDLQPGFAPPGLGIFVPQRLIAGRLRQGLQGTGGQVGFQLQQGFPNWGGIVKVHQNSVNNVGFEFFNGLPVEGAHFRGHHQWGEGRRWHWISLSV